MGSILRVNAVGALLVAVLFWLLLPDSPVADAAAHGDVETVRSLVKQGADVNAAQGDGMSALHWAAEEGGVELAEVLIQAGARVDALTRLGSYTPLHLASQRGHAAVVKVLLAAGADANAPTRTGAVRPLHFAAESGSVEALHALVDRDADVNAAEQQWGHTPLMFAAAKNRAASITALLQRGADPEVAGTVIDMLERERADLARKRRRDEIVEMLAFPPNTAPARLVGLESIDTNGIQPKARGNQTLRTAEDVGGYGGLTALTLAVRQGNVEAAVALLEGGADIDMPSKGDNTGPLLMATMNGHTDLAMLLLERGADPNKASDAGNRPLFAIIARQWMPTSRPPAPNAYFRQQTNYLEMMEALLEAGADANARLDYNVWHTTMNDDLLHVDWAGATAFLRASHGFDVAAMKLLVSYGADPNIATIRPRYWGAVNDMTLAGQGDAIELPKEWSDEIVDPSGLPVIPQGEPGFHPINMATGLSHLRGLQGTLHKYVPNGWMRAATYLIEELGADPNQRDFNGDTPLHNTAFRGDNELILYLVSKGADPLVVNRKGQTTVDKANGPIQRLEPFPETIKLLESLGAKNNEMCVSC